MMDGWMGSRNQENKRRKKRKQDLLAIVASHVLVSEGICVCSSASSPNLYKEFKLLLTMKETQVLNLH